MLLTTQKIGSQLLCALAQLEVGQSILIGDAFYPALDPNTEIVSGEGLQVHQLVDAISSIMPVSEVRMMAVVEGDEVGHSQALLESIKASLTANDCQKPTPTFIERYACYDLRPSLTIKTTHEIQYGNVWLTRGEGGLKGFAPELTPKALKALYDSGHGSFLSIMQANCDISIAAGIPTIEFEKTKLAINALVPHWSADHEKYSQFAAFFMEGRNEDLAVEMLKSVWKNDEGYRSFDEPIVEKGRSDIQLELIKARFHVLNVRTEEKGDGCIVVNKGLTRGLDSISPIEQAHTSQGE